VGEGVEFGFGLDFERDVIEFLRVEIGVRGLLKGEDVVGLVVAEEYESAVIFGDLHVEEVLIEGGDGGDVVDFEVDVGEFGRHSFFYDYFASSRVWILVLSLSSASWGAFSDRLFDSRRTSRVIFKRWRKLPHRLHREAWATA